MRRSLKALLLSGAVVAALAPATPAQAATCVGFKMSQGLEHAGAWRCSCPDDPYYGPLDGEWWLIVCIP